MTDALGSRKLGFIGGIEGLRAVAIVMVMLHHLAIQPHWFDGGRGGVDVFFVISGFLISSLIVNEFDRNGRLDLKRFYVRRLFRLMPAVIVMLVVVLAYDTLTDQPRGGGLHKAALYALFYVFNWAVAFGRSVPTAMLHLWSLSVEEQFYFIVPLVLAFALRRFGRRSIVNGIAAIGVFGVAWRGLLCLGDASQNRIRFGLDTHADGLVLGCLIGVAFASGMFPKVFAPSRLKEILGPVSLLVLGAITVGQQPFKGDEFVSPALHAAAGGFAVWALIGQERGWHITVLNLAPVRRLGKVSYGMYLWHLPVEIYTYRAMGADVSAWIRTPVAWAVAYAFTEASFWLVETPMMRFSKTRSVVPAAA